MDTRCLKGTIHIDVKERYANPVPTTHFNVKMLFGFVFLVISTILLDVIMKNNI